MDVTGVISAGVTDTDASNCNTAADDRPEMPGATVKDDTTAPTTEAADAKGTTAPPQNTGSGEVDEEIKSEEQKAPVGTGNPYKKRKVAVYMAYVGEGYRGMQHNPGSKTIEGELMHAMVKAGAVSEENSDAFEKVNWKRAARTDKGVSAVGNVVSLRMTLHPPCMVERINEQLPEQVRGPVDCRDCSSHPATQHSNTDSGLQADDRRLRCPDGVRPPTLRVHPPCLGF